MGQMEGFDAYGRIAGMKLFWNGRARWRSRLGGVLDQWMMDLRVIASKQGNGYAANRPGGSGRGSMDTCPMGRVRHLNGAPWVGLKYLWVPDP
jgi:hypothetical protein